MYIIIMYVSLHHWELYLITAFVAWTDYPHLQTMTGHNNYYHSHINYYSKSKVKIKYL